MQIPLKQVIEEFITNGNGARGANVLADERSGVVYSTFGGACARIPLAVRLKNDSFLGNSAGLDWPWSRHQRIALQTLENSGKSFGVVPFGSIVAAWSNGEIRDWNRAAFSLEDFRKEVEIVIPSAGERWRKVMVRDKYGRGRTERVHTLGDGVIRLRDHFYLSGVDETGQWGGVYFFTQLVSDSPPRSYEEALNSLKPKIVQQAEARGAYVKRQGEWFAIPTTLTTSKLLRDVECGVANRREGHILGRDGHHRLEEAVVYRFGPQRGEVYARGVMSHTAGKHTPLQLGIRWHRIVHNVQGATYHGINVFD